MKKEKLIYRVSTGIVSAVTLFSIISFTMFDHTMYPEGAFNHLGLPPYFKVEITIAKILGLLALLLPGIPVKVREFAYAGFGITFASASFAHYSVGDGLLYIIDPLLFLGCLIVSYIYWKKIKNFKSNASFTNKGIPPEISVVS